MKSQTRSAHFIQKCLDESVNPDPSMHSSRIAAIFRCRSFQTSRKILPKLPLEQIEDEVTHFELTLA